MVYLKKYGVAMCTDSEIVEMLKEGERSKYSLKIQMLLEKMVREARSGRA